MSSTLRSDSRESARASRLAHSSTTPAVAVPASRDLVVDFIRVACMFAVVAVHLLMMGISVDESGIGVGNPLTSLSWFAQGTWFGQVMPLFFIVGGFASLTSWRSLKRKGGDGGDYLRNRVLRLVRPTVALYIFLAIALWSATAAGVPVDLLAVIAAGAGVQLWFLAAYLICQAMVPTMAKFHEAAPYRTIAALAAGAVVVDVLRLGLERNPWGFDSNPIGLLNMVFVWGLLQQLGFFYADGFFDRFAKWKLVLAAAGCYAVMVPLTHAGPYPVDMLTSQNPPMFPLILVGLAHILLVKAAYPVLQRCVHVGWVQKVMYRGGQPGDDHLPVAPAVDHRHVWHCTGPSPAVPRTRQHRVVAQSSAVLCSCLGTGAVGFHAAGPPGTRQHCTGTGCDQAGHVAHRCRNCPGHHSAVRGDEVGAGRFECHLGCGAAGDRRGSGLRQASGQGVEDPAQCFIGVRGFLTFFASRTAVEQPDGVALRPLLCSKEVRQPPAIASSYAGASDVELRRRTPLPLRSPVRPWPRRPPTTRTQPLARTTAQALRCHPSRP